MDQNLNWDECYKVFRILHNVREKIGDSDFGLRAQGLLAHTLLRLGNKIIEINAQGHPDIIVEMENQLIRLEVEAAIGKGRRRIIKDEDLEAIKPRTKNEIGYFAVLDCGLPFRWLLIDYERLKWRNSELLFMITLYALLNEKISIKCTEEFSHMILSNAKQLPSLTFSILRNRALRGEII